MQKAGDDAGGRGRLPHDELDGLGALLACDVEGVVELDRTRLAYRFGDRPPGVGLAVGDAAAVEHRGGGVDAEHQRGDLVGEPCLAHSGLTQQQDHLAAVVRDRELDEIAQHRELGVAPDQRGDPTRPVARRNERLGRRPHVDGRLSTANDQRAPRLVTDDLAGGLVGRCADEHLAGVGGRLEAGCRVHHIAHRGVVASGAERPDEHFAGVHADPHADADGRFGRVLGECLLHTERGANRPLGIVLVSDRGAEQRHDGVADDLVHATAEVVHIVDEAFERDVDQPLHPLGIEVLRESGEADDVGEDHGDHTSLVGVGAGGVATRRAEPGVRPVVRPTVRARHRPSSYGCCLPQTLSNPTEDGRRTPVLRTHCVPWPPVSELPGRTSA